MSCLCKLSFYIKIPCGICSKGFWNKRNTLHTTSILTSMLLQLLTYLMKISLIRRNLEHRVVYRNIPLNAVNSASQIFGEKKHNSEVICLNILLSNLCREKSSKANKRINVYTLLALSRCINL